MSSVIKGISECAIKYINYHVWACTRKPTFRVFGYRKTNFINLNHVNAYNCSKLGNITSNNSHSTKYSLNNTLILSGILTFLGLKSPEPESELIMSIKRGILLIQRGEFKKSEQMLHVALKLAQDLKNQQAVVYIYDVMANLAFDVGEFEKAEKLFISVMQHSLTSGVPQDDNKIIHMSLKLASIYNAKKDTRKAEEGFQFCMKNLQKKVDDGTTDEDTLLLWCMTLDWYARFVLQQDRFKEAFTYFEKAYNMCVEINGPVHEQTVVLLNDLGTICCMQADYDGAIKYLKQAVSIGESIPNMEDFASIYINLGTVYLKKNMFEEAKRACEDGWKNAKSHNNEEGLGEANICLDKLKQKIPLKQRI